MDLVAKNYDCVNPSTNMPFERYRKHHASPHTHIYTHKSLLVENRPGLTVSYSNAKIRVALHRHQI